MPVYRDQENQRHKQTTRKAEVLPRHKLSPKPQGAILFLGAAWLSLFGLYAPAMIRTIPWHAGPVSHWFPYLPPGCRLSVFISIRASA
jgi:hypothetical protein